MSGLIRIGAFAKKEMTEIFRQPRLLLTLILGPFLILLLFGIGYRNEGRNLRVIIVVAKQDPVHGTVRQYANQLGSQFQLTGISDNLEESRGKLRRRDVDLVVIVPDRAERTLQQNQQAVITLLHNEVDPYQADYIEFTGQLYVDKLNRWLLGSTIEEKKSEVGIVQKDIGEAIRAIQTMREALDRREIAAAQESQKSLSNSFGRIESRLESEIARSQDLDASDVQELRNRRKALRERVESLGQLDPEKTDYLTEARTAAEIERDLTYVQARLTQFRRIDPKVLVSPFTTKSSTIAKMRPELPQFFIPSVIVLLLQHLAVTFASLSVVREFRTGAAELFRVSPLRPLEMMLGKYLGYFLVGAFVAAILTAALLFGLRVPALGDLRLLGAILAVLLFSSLSIGFLLSLLAKTETQAIQYTMIFLLVSIFFSGFLLNLELLWEPIRLISWLLPATYGIRLTQDNILRGETPDLFLLALLLTMGAYFFVVSYRILRRRIAQT